MKCHTKSKDVGLAHRIFVYLCGVPTSLTYAVTEERQCEKLLS